MFINNNINIYININIIININIYIYILCSTLFNIIQHYSTLFNIIQYHSTRKFETLHVEAPDLLRRPPKRRPSCHGCWSKAQILVPHQPWTWHRRKHGLLSWQYWQWAIFQIQNKILWNRKTIGLIGLIGLIGQELKLPDIQSDHQRHPKPGSFNEDFSPRGWSSCCIALQDRRVAPALRDEEQVARLLHVDGRFMGNLGDQ